MGGSRRRLLGVLSALPLVGAALAAVPEDATAAKAKGKRKSRGSGPSTEQERQRPGTEAPSCAKRCRKKSSKQARRKCRKRCIPPSPECTTSQDCPAGELCESGLCIPIPDQCGADTDCDQCERCASGVCVAQCAPDEVCRGNQCEPVTCTLDADCGDCSRCVDGRCRWQCTVTEVCLSGAGGRCCQPRSCPAGKDCGTVDDGCGGQARCGASTCTQPSDPCQDAVCIGNVCTTGPGHDGASCDDGDACTVNDVCTSGVCGGSPKCASGQDCVGGTCCTTAGNTATLEIPCCTGLTQCVDGVCKADCCAGVSCGVCQTCQGGACVADAAQSGTCCDGTDGVCAGGVCTPCDAFPNSFCDAALGTCACTPDATCPGGQTCGSASDGCGGLVSCGSCGSGTTPACNAGTCATCADTCRAACYYCLNLVDGSTRCGDGYGFSCGSPCSSNAECTGGQLCLSTYTERSSGQTTSVQADCSQTAPGVCATLSPCFS